MGEMERKMAAALQPEAKVQRVNTKKRQARTTPDDALWEAVSGHKRQKKKETKKEEDEEDEEEEEVEEEEEEEEEEEVEEVYGEVDEIQQIRVGKDGQLEVLVKWTGYSAEFNTWEDFTQMGNALECVEDFLLLKSHLFKKPK